MGRAQRWLRLLLAASIVLPVLIFAGVGWVAYDRQLTEARARLGATLNVAFEHDLKVFETFDLVGRYTDELFEDISDDRISAGEAEYHTRLHSLTNTLPQLRDIWVIDKTGRPLVSGTIFPMPKINLSDREYFAAQRDRKPGESFVSEEFQSRAADRRVFLISRRRVIKGKSDFQGIITTAIAPDYFTEYYAKLPLPQNGLMAIVRADGVVLARYPIIAHAPDRLSPAAGFYRATARAPESGTYTSVSPVDGVTRVIAYRRLPRHPVYVLSGFEVRAVTHEWMMAMGAHLYFGVPATLAMVLLSWFALGHARSESLAYTRLRQEVLRRETTEAALRQSQKMEAIGRLTGGIAHDFNNLLTAILGNVDLALNRFGKDDAKLNRYLSSAREASRRAATLVTRLLSFSRQHPLEVEIVDVNRLVHGMSDLLLRTIGETITIETVLASGLWKAEVDPNQLESAILNLAINARDAMPDGGRLTIATVNAPVGDKDVRDPSAESQGDYVKVSVADTGAGMSKDILERAFEPFFTTKPAGIGTGLGLSMVYGFVNQSKGHVRISSAIGKGTTIELYLPRASGDTPPRLADEAGPAMTDRLRSETILLVEDDEEVARFGTEVLRDLGYTVHTAADGPAALQVIEKISRIDLLFTDVVLPGGMNGRELALAAQKRRPGLRVLFASGYTRDAIIHEGRLDPDVELLSKPFTYDGLAQRIRRVLDATPAAAGN